MTQLTFFWVFVVLATAFTTASIIWPAKPLLVSIAVGCVIGAPLAVSGTPAK